MNTQYQEKSRSDQNQLQAQTNKLFTFIVFISGLLILTISVIYTARFVPFNLGRASVGNKYQKPTGVPVRPTTLQSADQIIFEKTEGWDPCPPGGEPCTQITTLSKSGKIDLQGNKTGRTFIRQELINKVLTEIADSGVMDKECEASLVLDYSATYKITHNDRIKTIRFPGCEQELKKIENIFL